MHPPQRHPGTTTTTAAVYAVTAAPTPPVPSLSVRGLPRSQILPMPQRLPLVLAAALVALVVLVAVVRPCAGLTPPKSVIMEGSLNPLPCLCSDVDPHQSFLNAKVRYFGVEVHSGGT